MGSQQGKDEQQGSGWQTWWSHTHVWMNQEEQLGSEKDM